MIRVARVRFARARTPVKGYSGGGSYFAECHGRRVFRAVEPAAVRERVQLRSAGPLFLLVHARRDSVRDVFATVPQQSDYVSDWAGAQVAVQPQHYQAWKESPLLRPIRRIRRSMLLRRPRKIFSLANRAFYEPADLRVCA